MFVDWLGCAFVSICLFWGIGGSYIVYMFRHVVSIKCLLYILITSSSMATCGYLRFSSWYTSLARSLNLPSGNVASFCLAWFLLGWNSSLSCRNDSNLCNVQSLCLCNRIGRLTTYCVYRHSFWLVHRRHLSLIHETVGCLIWIAFVWQLIVD